MSWLFSQALVAEYSADTCLDGAPCAQLNVMPTPHKFWRNDKTMDASDLSRFGLTLRLLTDDHGEALLTWYRAAFPVRTSAQLVEEQALMGIEADSGARWQGSFARYSPDASMWKTAQCSLLADSDEFLETWPRWGSMRSGASYLRPTPALPTFESESGLWPTPNAMVASNDLNLRCSGDGRTKPNKLGWAVAETGANGLLNPAWVEWLMGWPIGWTELKPLEMARFHEWQQQHGSF